MPGWNIKRFFLKFDPIIGKLSLISHPIYEEFIFYSSYFQYTGNLKIVKINSFL